MKKFFCGLCGVLVWTVNSQATVIFSENFNSYANGNLTNQGPWLQTAAAANPVQVANGNSGKVASLFTGQDVYAAFGSPYNPYTIADGTSFYIGLTLNVSAATAGGDYFLHVTPSAGNSSAFFERFFVKSSGSGFVLGYLETSGTGGVINYGSTVWSFNTDYRAVIAYNAVAGTVNDTASVYVNPTDYLVQGNNAAEISDLWTTVFSETNKVAAINLRQGGSTTAATLSVDDIFVGTTFADVSAAPEPSSIALVGLGLLALSFIRRRN
ncbi:MAG: PEP-CTERM sorting domain-containing protein [Verrucomicrobiota bacterium]